MKIALATLLLFFCFMLSAQDDFTVNIHEYGDPDGMNPMTSSSANGLYIQNNIFCKLLEFNQQTFELEPLLAAKLPVVELINEGKYKGGMSISYEIHPDAVWDNGSPVTAQDYIFTIKAIRNPKVNNLQLRPYFEFIDDIVVDGKDPKKFTIYSKVRYFRAVESSGIETFVLPEYHYDPKGLMKGFDLDLLVDVAYYISLVKNPKIVQFAEKFNGFEFDRQVGEVVGCGPYRMVEWLRGKRLVLERKKDWWGYKTEENTHLKAYPAKIVYKTVVPIKTALADAKYGKLDLLRNVPPDRFLKLKKDSNYISLFDFNTPMQLAYHYLGFNSKNPKLSDIRVRKAITHAVDRDFIVSEIFKETAIKINSPIFPDKTYYNKNIKALDFDLKKAKAFLAEAGWKDSNNDGILEKKINGEWTDLRLKFTYNHDNYVRRQIGEMLQDNLAKIMIKLDLEPVDFPVLLYKADARDFDIVALAWVKTPGLDDMRQIWHSDADTKGGSNRVGFGTAETDKIIEEIRMTLDAKKRLELYHKIQEEIVAEHCYVFLVQPKELIMVRKSFDYPKFSAVRPGYVSRLFQLKKK